MVPLPPPAGQFASASQTIGTIFHVIYNGAWNDTSQGFVSLDGVINQVAVLNQCVLSPPCPTCSPSCDVLHERFCICGVSFQAPQVHTNTHIPHYRQFRFVRAFMESGVVNPMTTFTQVLWHLRLQFLPAVDDLDAKHHVVVSA
jgi:hypothetical protein